MSTLRDRIGVDIGADLSVLDAVSWAAENKVQYIDIRIDEVLVNGLDETTANAVQEKCSSHNIHLGLHTLSAVNMAATEPYLSDAVDTYLAKYLQVADQLGAGWIVVHGGYHFTADRENRVEAGLDRLQRVLDQAEALGIDLLLENHNPEPTNGEIHYLPVTIDECKQYFDILTSDRLRWAFTVNHAHMLPAGIDGFLTELDIEQCGEVRIADNRGEWEEHLQPGEGTINFESLFERLEREQFTGHYMLAFNDLSDMIDGRDYLIDLV